MSASGRYQWVKKHLPYILHHETLGDPDAKLIILNDPKYEEKELRLLVQTELFPITQLTDAATVKRVFGHIVRCKFNHILDYQH
jgi:hypothetical protein